MLNDGESQVTLAASIYQRIKIQMYKSITIQIKSIMKKSIIRIIREQRMEWREFARAIGLKNMAQQMAVGIAVGFIILFVCGFGEWVHDLICK